MLKKDNYITQVLLHIFIGIALYLFQPLSSLYFVIILVYFTGRIILAPNNAKTKEVLLASAYFIGVEVLIRMTKGGIAYEASKYLVILFMLLGIFFKGISGRAYPYFFYLMALVPAIIVASVTLSFDARFRTNIAFVLSGPVTLGIAALFCYDRKVTTKLLLEVINYIALPTIALTSYLFLYNPSIKETLTGTASNLAASGGFGPNQVSTALGLGMFAVVVRFFIKSPSIGLKILNLLIFGAITFRAIVTFSRGGVLTAIIIVAAFLWFFFNNSSVKKRNQIVWLSVLFGLAIATTWVISSNQTEGLIDKRYANENARGLKKDDITTGRVDLFLEEIDGFLSSPFLGIGASKVKDRRKEDRGVIIASHNEIGRTLSEHGFLGIIILLVLIIKPLSFRTINKRNLFFYSFLFFWFATINHSGMRIAAPSFLYALALLNVVYEKHPVHRKQIRQ